MADSSSSSSSSSSNAPSMLLAGLVCRGNVHLVIGTNPLAAARCSQSLAAGAQPVVVAPDTAALHYGLQRRIDEGDVRWEKKAFADDDVLRLGRDEVGHVVDAVFVTLGPREAALSAHIAQLCRRHRIPVNVVDAPKLCTFTLLAVHTDGPLQVGVTTNGHGCKLASRIRREIASSLPRGLGQACVRLGDVRRRIQLDDAGLDLDDSLGQGALFNRIVTDDDDDVRNRRMRWLSQVCEYWPLKKLAAVADDDDVDRLLAAYSGAAANGAAASTTTTTTGEDDAADARLRTGRLVLAGSGPGHPSLLTRATLSAIGRADVVLSDKLVPSAVLDLIPRRTPVHIARKFPGNADSAQEELLEAALESVRAGKTVLRLKQGDPFVYGRGGEEVNWFARRGLAHRVTVLPGVTSALSAPLFAGVPVTQRDVADQVLICTGTGKKGRPPAPPEYVASRTVVFLMALHRIAGLVAELTTHAAPGATRALWPPTTPCAVVERGSCPDQRVIRTTLAHVAAAVESLGSRPPGLLVVGGACEALRAPGDVAVAWTVEEGFQGLDDDDEPSASPAALDGVPRVGGET